jgi:hypothetical protein
MYPAVGAELQFSQYTDEWKLSSEADMPLGIA